MCLVSLNVSSFSEYGSNLSENVSIFSEYMSSLSEYGSNMFENVSSFFKCKIEVYV